MRTISWARAFVALAAVCCFAQTAPKIEHYSLPNGMRVAFHVNERAATVHVNIRYRVGAKYERPGRTGFSHLFEHLLGQGVRARDFTAEAEEIGSSGVSGSARHDFTELFETVPSSRLERILWLEAERFSKLASAITQDRLDKERDIVRNERGQKVENHLNEPKEVEVRDRVPREATFLAWPGPGQRSPEFAALEVAAFVLNGPRLESAGTRARFEILDHEDASILLIHASPRESTLGGAEAAIASQLAILGREGPSEDEVARARNNLEFGELSATDTAQGLASAIHQANLILDSPGRVGEWVSRHRSVTAKSVQEAVRRWMDTPNRVTIRVRPEPSTGATPGSPDLPEPPFQTERKVVAPEIQSARLANGLEVLVLERRDLPKVSVQLRLKIGPAQNPLGKQGLALLTIAGLARGTASRGTAEFDRESSTLALKTSSGADAESVSLSFDALTRNLKPGMNLMADALLHPSLGQFEKDKADWLERMKSAATKPDDYHGARSRSRSGAIIP